MHLEVETLVIALEVVTFVPGEVLYVPSNQLVQEPRELKEMSETRTIRVCVS